MKFTRVWMGILATLTGAAAGHAVAAALRPGASPVVAVGSVVIDLTPTPVKDWAVAAFGTADKAVLLGGVAVVAALLGGLAGLLVHRSRVAALSLVGLLGGLCVVAALTRSGAGPIDAVPGIVAAVVGGWLLVWFPRWVGAGSSAASAVGRPANPARRLLLGSALLVGVSGFLGWLGLRGATPADQAGAVPPTLPPPTAPLGPLPEGLDAVVPGISPLRTPTSDFYRVDIALAVPRVQHADWRLGIDGLVEEPFSIGWDELAAMPMIERDITLTCVSNGIGGPYVGSTRWLGVPVAELLRRARPRATADMVLSSSRHDGFSAGTPLEVLLDGRDAMIAVAMDGQPLVSTHGAPARLLTPGLYGFVGATKWVTRLEVTRFADAQAYWTGRGWAERAPVKTACRIDTPSSSSRLAAGEVAVGGVAWATHRGISRVELRVDDGPWQTAQLSTDMGIDYWRQWVVPWQATPGRHRLAARAWDGAGVVQPEEPSSVVPDGPTGYHMIDVSVG